MEKKIILGVIALIVASITLVLMIPEKPVNTTPDTLPWNITHPTPETTRVFGITLGKSTLAEVAQTFQYESELTISLFKPTDAKMGVEAFFEEVNFNGLKAKIIMTVAVPDQELQGMYQRGLRLNTTPSGKRITLTAEDLARVNALPISTLTYLPNSRVDEAVIVKRFGTPAQRIREKDGGLVHWLYPQHGLDVVMDSKPFFQYVAIKDFSLLSTPLQGKGEVLK
ncbi:MAG: hypothetical protein PHH47_12380 [Gallionella sp.]|nr:hypothetical protein [Gallionella sp.]MDD4947613.1 hypothetical protein [Gallionella sp.]MDD5611514.1 hypothetical protein [Gallionella sp.]